MKRIQKRLTRGGRNRQSQPSTKDATQTDSRLLELLDYSRDISEGRQKPLDSPHLKELARLTGQNGHFERLNLLDFLFRVTDRPRELAFEDVFAFFKHKRNATEAAKLLKIHIAAESILATIASLSEVDLSGDFEKESDFEEGFQDLLDWVANDAPKLANICRHLEILSEAADLAAVRLDPPSRRRKGRPRQFNLHLLVFALANAYEAFSGRKFTYYRTKAPEYEPVSKGHCFVWHSIEFLRETLPNHPLSPAPAPRAIATECERAVSEMKGFHLYDLHRKIPKK